MRLSRLAVSVALLMLGAACRVPVAVDAGCRPSGLARPRQLSFGGSRPVTLSVPRAYDAACPAPLVLVLHGYGAAGKLQEAWLGLGSLVDGRGVLLASPDGLVDANGKAFWNATEACCNFDRRPVDDVKYLADLLKEIRAVYNVDPRRIFVVGHSNGGFMAHRLGCELAPDIAAVVSLAGTTSLPPGACQGTAPVSVLQIHGDEDALVSYDGGTNLLERDGGAYAGALEATARWAKVDGCKTTRTEGAPIDLDTALPGAETLVSTFDGCPAGVDVALWTIRGGGHGPAVSGKFAGAVWRWLEAHPRP